MEEGTDRWVQVVNIWFKNKSSPNVFCALAEILFEYREMKWGRIGV